MLAPLLIALGGAEAALVAEVYALDREPFLLAVTGHASVRTSADGVMRRRLEELAAASPAEHG